MSIGGPPGRWRRVAASVRRASAAAGDDAGFSLLESLMSLTFIGVVGTFALSFQLASSAAANEQANRQAAAEVVARALDTARAVGGAALLADPPTTTTAIVNGITYTASWSVVGCRQVTPGAACSTAIPSQPGTVELVRVALDVRWDDSRGVQVQTAATMLSAAQTDPTFPT